MRAFAASLVLLVAGPALADIPPPEGYVEQCTAQKQCKATDESDTCRAWHSARDKCKKQHEADGFVYMCKTRGASAWSEVYCRPKNATKKAAEKPAEKK